MSRFYLPFLVLVAHCASAQTFTTTQTYLTKVARQAVAVDENYFYAINSDEIAKHEIDKGQPISYWKAPDSSHVKHLNSGKVVNGKLYCAHSNYPAVPRLSTIEIWDTETLKHIETHEFGAYDGAANWITWREDGSCWVLFAHYSGKRSEPDRSSADTRLDKFDANWNRLASYTFPKEVIDMIDPKSLSGGDWGPDGMLYCTGHDSAEVYVLKLPESGTVLEYVKSIPVECEGQGIAFDSEGNLWTIKRKSREVVISRFEP